MPVQLRPFQAQLKTDVLKAWGAGARDVMAVSATGSGKTVFFSDIVQHHPGASVVIAHRQELVSQISIALARNGVRHRVIGSTALQRTCAKLHADELGRSYVDPSAKCAAAGVDTLVRMDPRESWFQQVTLRVHDEAHHVLQDNKWGSAAAMFPNAIGLHVTATPVRADGAGLGRHADGLVDAMILAPGMRDLIDMGYLTDYRIYAPPSAIDLSRVAISSATGDFNATQVREAVHDSGITGDVVSHYCKLAPGKLGVTFAVDVAHASEIAEAFRAAGVPAEVVSAKTPDALRAAILRRFKNRDVLQLVNVDLFGEGFDLPAIECVSMARPTQSFSLYCLDPETEVLTPGGWKNHAEIDACDSVIGFDMNDSSVRPVPIESRIKRPLYDGETMYGIDGPHLNFTVSDKHDMLVKSRSATAKRWQKQTAETVANRSSMFAVPVAGDGAYTGANLTDDELRLLGWFLSDGAINKRNGALQIGQSVAKPEHIASIRNTIAACGLKCGEYVSKRRGVPKTHNDLIVFTVSKGAPRGRDKHLSGWAHLAPWLDKSIPECYDQLTREQLLTLLETLNLGDGVNNHGSLDYVKHTLTITCGTNFRMADRLQALCVTRGLRCNIAYPHYDGRSKWAILHIRDARTATIAGRNVKDGAVSGKKAYERSRVEATTERPPFVWCVSNELGTLITRRAGKVIIMGNCQQFGRALRLMIPPDLVRVWDTFDDATRRAHITMSSKPRAIIIDHVNNVIRHGGPPDRRMTWSLDRRERRSKPADDAIPLRTCLNLNANGTGEPCLQPYERIHKACPHCGFAPEPAQRSAPAQVDGDLIELDAATLAALRGDIERADAPFSANPYLAPEINGAHRKHHAARQEAQSALRDAMALWGGLHTNARGAPMSEAHRRFYFQFGTDAASAQTLNARDALALAERIRNDLQKQGVIPG